MSSLTNGNSKEDWLIFEILCGATVSSLQTKPYQTNYPVSNRASLLSYIDIGA